ncbi:unnamed protein product [Rhodiola kirilowii]
MKYANEIQKQRIPVAKPSITPVDEFRENPRNYSGGGSMYGGKGIGAVSGGILERYRDMLRERDEDVLRAEDEVPPLSTEEVVRIYEALLVDLTMNSKPVITDLTIIAGEQRDHGEGIADAICCRIVEAPVDRKLPSLYLLDSIVKNIGCEYIDYFSARLPEVFLEAYRQVDPNLYPALRHLFGTWSKVFPDSVLQKIDAQLQLMSESPRLSHGIHVNPKYVEARRHSESILDNGKQRARVASSPLSSYGQFTRPNDEYDLDSSDFIKAEERTVISTGLAGRASPNLGTDRWFTERESFLIEPDYKQGRSTERDSGTSESWRKYSSDRNYPKLDSSSAYNERIDPRALIDAYGSDRRKESKSNWQDTPKALIDAYGNDRGTERQPHWRNNQLNVRHLEENTISNKAITTSWKNTEEVEYDWEDMSSTLVDGGRSNNSLKSHLQHPGGSLRTRYEPGVLGVSSDSEFRGSNLSTSVPASVLTRGTTGNLPVHRDQRIHSSFQPSQSFFNSNGRGNIQIPHPANNSVSTVGEDVSLGYLPELNAQLHKPPIGALSGGLTNFDTSNGDGPIGGLVGAWPLGTMQKSQQPPSYSVLPQQKQFGQLNSMNGGDTVGNQVVNDPRFLPERRFGTALNSALPSQSQFPNQHPGYFSNQQPNQMQATTSPPQYLSSQEGHGVFGPTATVPGPSRLGARPLHHGSIPQGNISYASKPVPNAVPGAFFPNTIPSGQPFMGGASVSFSVPRPGPPLMQTSGYPQNLANQAAGNGAFSGLISSLMSQGLISLTNQQDSVGVDFNPETLKVRHDSAITALYTDLPRQCTTCGLRFKDQELHRNHMDWHVTKNRMNKNRKQKASRKWFASASMWLSGTEASGPEAVPGFLPTETVVENQDEEEMAVPADEDQTTCELCGEPFDDFYSHETDEWMYRGAVYLNANTGSTAGLDRSQLGPIVHAKCRPDPATSSQNVAATNQFNDVDDSQRKRLRVS